MAIKKLYVHFKTHLDIGFTDTSEKQVVINYDFPTMAHNDFGCLKKVTVM